MTAFAGEFNLPRLERVISGPGTVDTLGRELERRSLTRAVIVTGKTLGGSVLLDRVIAALGGTCALVFRGARQHTPSSTVEELTRVLRDASADAVISFGGGSPIDTAKGALHALMTAAGGGDAHVGDRPVHIAIPTTLSAGEFTSVAGITDDRTRIKRPVFDARIAPRTVITDPTVTLETPPRLWAATGIRALDHAVESIYSVRHHPFSDAVASRAITLLVDHLPPSLEATGTEQLEHRAHCQLAAWMAVFGMTHAGFGLSHALGHQIGPRWNVPHGITSCITLPHVMRFMAQFAADRFPAIARGFGMRFDDSDPVRAALACADRTRAFIERLGLPTRLRDVAVPRDQIDAIADVVGAAMRDAAAGERHVTRDELSLLLADLY